MGLNRCIVRFLTRRITYMVRNNKNKQVVVFKKPQNTIPTSDYRQDITRLEAEIARLRLQLKEKRQRETPFTNTGGALGGSLGAMVGMPSIGAAAGRFLGAGIGSIFGSGDYTLTGPKPSYNVMYNSTQTPKFSSGLVNTNVISNREYIGDVLGTTNFTLSSYPINPGQGKTFPWLSTVAQSYQEYKIHGLIFEFKSLITDFVTAGAPGVVVAATSYNADAPLFDSKQRMESSEFATSVKPTLGLMHGVECATNQTILPQRFVRMGGVESDSVKDLSLYDLGNFQLATQGNPNGVVIGELWVSYVVEFFKPQLPRDIGGTQWTGMLTSIAVSTASFLGGGTLQQTSGSLQLNPVYAGGNCNAVTFIAYPQNEYFIQYTVFGTIAALVNPPSFGITNCDYISVMNNGNSPTTASFPAAVANSTTLCKQVYYRCTRNSPGLVTFTLSDNTSVLPGGVTGVNLLVQNINDTIETY